MFTITIDDADHVTLLDVIERVAPLYDHESDPMQRRAFDALCIKIKAEGKPPKRPEA